PGAVVAGEARVPLALAAAEAPGGGTDDPRPPPRRCRHRPAAGAGAAHRIFDAVAKAGGATAATPGDNLPARRGPRRRSTPLGLAAPRGGGGTGRLAHLHPPARQRRRGTRPALSPG